MTVYEGADVTVNVAVGEYAVIKPCVSIGSGARVDAYTVLGSIGFRFERDNRGMPMRFPHLGRVVLARGSIWAPINARTGERLGILWLIDSSKAITIAILRASRMQGFQY